MADELQTGRPSYAANFVCIGPQCEDTCCVGWEIPLDRATYEHYRNFPPDRLGRQVQQFVQIAPAGTPIEQFASIKLSQGRCGFLAPDLLCGIQKEYGGPLLPATCSIYPRVLNQVDGAYEGSLMMSCPEAARNILLTPGSTSLAGDLQHADFRKDICYELGVNGPGLLYKPFHHYRAVRTWIVAMVQDRTRPMWQRLLLIGSLCKRLSEISNSEQAELIPAILADHFKIIATDWGSNELMQMESHPRARLKLIVRITELLAQELTCGPRFFDTYWTFLEGIGSAPDSQLGKRRRSLSTRGANLVRPLLRTLPPHPGKLPAELHVSNSLPLRSRGQPQLPSPLNLRGVPADGNAVRLDDRHPDRHRQPP